MSDETVSLGEKLRLNANGRGGKPAVSCGDATLTYSELHARTNRLARGLMAMGVRKGDLVTVGLPNGIGFVEASFALWKLGATPQPVSFRLPRAEIEAIVDLADSRLVIADFDYELGRPISNIDAILSRAEDDSDLPDAVAEVARALTSGGSTGRPKLILAGQRGVTPRDATVAPPWGFNSDSVVIVPAPMYHSTGFVVMMSAIAVGAHLIIMSGFDPEAALAEIQQRRATWIYFVPTMMNRIWRLPEDVRAKYDPTSLEMLWHLAAPCPPWLKEVFIDWIGAEKIYELYSGTEGVAVTIITGQEWLQHRGSVGRVVGGNMKVVDENGEELAAGEIGDIFLKTADGAPAAFEYRGATATTLPGGWVTLGDIGWFDDDGYLYLADRRTDMILVGGANVYPAEIEAALAEHPAVQSVAVIGLPDDDIGNVIHAIVQPYSPVTPDELKAHIASRLVIYKQPRTYEFTSEPLRDDAGKVRRSALREARLKVAS